MVIVDLIINWQGNVQGIAAVDKRLEKSRLSK